MAAEEWRDIPGYEGLYSINNNGIIKSYPKQHGAVFKEGKILNQKLTTQKYASVVLSNNKKSKTIFVHRLVALAFIPNPENKPEVNHKDCDRLNNHVSNLEWNTRTENEAHARRNSKNWKGEGHPMCKLTNNQVAEIKKLYSEKAFTQTELAKKYGVTQATISALILNKYRNGNNI